ncbi:MAG: Gfo/Idh/MocA family oxidoreductase, partial [Sulfurimonas sp.]
MKVLIIGYGSIGKRHHDVLSKFSQIKTIELVTKQNIETMTCYKSLEYIENINEYDYLIIASETNKHFEQLNYLEEKVKDKLVFCEKPLFESKKILDVKNNRVFVGYVLRFHPLLEKLKEFLKNEHIISINA